MSKRRKSSSYAPVRRQLQEHDGERTRFTAGFVRFGTTSNRWNPYAIETLLLADVRFIDGRPATEHLWFKAGKWSKELELQPGMRIAFDARVSTYFKGYYRDELDYRLSFPTKAEVVERPEPETTEMPAASPGTDANPAAAPKPVPAAPKPVPAAPLL